jgi:APA family basic amino acid/polyamine antiporter
MFPKLADNMLYKRGLANLLGFIYGWSFLRLLGTIAAVGVAFSKFAAIYFLLLVIKYFLYELGFKLNAAQIVSIITIILLSYVNSRLVKNSKTFTKQYS